MNKTHKILGARRRGALLNDALIALIIVVVSVIPVVGLISHVYSSTISSADISEKLNAHNDKVDELIWDYMYDEMYNAAPDSAAKYLDDFTPLPDVRTFQIVNNGAQVDVKLVVSEDVLRAGRRSVSIKTYMLKMP